MYIEKKLTDDEIGKIVKAHDFMSRIINDAPEIIKNSTTERTHWLWGKEKLLGYEKIYEYCDTPYTYAFKDRVYKDVRGKFLTNLYNAIVAGKSEVFLAGDEIGEFNYITDRKL